MTGGDLGPIFHQVQEVGGWNAVWLLFTYQVILPAVRGLADPLRELAASVRELAGKAAASGGPVAREGEGNA